MATPHTVSASGTTTTITGDSPDPSVTGQAITVGFTVTGAAPTPTGNVTVTDGVVSCVGALNVSATGTCNLVPTTAGVETLRRPTPGMPPHGGSISVGITHNVNAASTTTTIGTDNPDPSVVGQADTVTYTVVAAAPGGGTPTGNVTVSDGMVSCTGTVAAGTCTLTPTTAGAKTLTATYAGDAIDRQRHDGPSGERRGYDHSDQRRHAGPSAVNVAYAVTYTVTVNAPGAGTPTGNVTVSDGTASCTATVAAGTCNLTSTTTGAKTLTATYGGDGNFAGSLFDGAAHR